MKTPKFVPLVYLSAICVCLMLIMVLPFTMVSQRPAMQLSLRPLNDGDDDDDKTLSPYFFIKSDDSSIDQLPLKETSADVNIAGVIADVKVTQVYTNNGEKPIEALYVFPASSRAAVYEMKMTIGDRLMIAKIEEKSEAKKQYEEAKNNGQSASLLEQDRPNVFQMNVANIMPGDTVKVEMYYTELLLPENAVYEFVYPTVVGPRYSNKSEATASANDQWVESPYTKEGFDPSYTFNISTRINAGMKIKAISCVSHKVTVDYESNNSALISLKKSDSLEGNKDFVLQYKLADKAIESGVLLYQGEKNPDENFFVTMIQPPATPDVDIDKVPPRDYIFIMDVSGSMMGFPVETSKKLLKELINDLRPVDKFNVMLFSDSYTSFADKSISATNDNLNKAIKFIEQQSGGGGTELLPALTKALSYEKSEGYSRTFVIATDGYVDVEKDAFDLIKKNLSNSNFFAFGIGSSVNRYLIEGMAHVGLGEPFIVLEQSDCDKKAEKFKKYIQTPVLTNISVEYNGFETYDVEPMNVPDVMAERPIIIYGKYKGEPKGTITIKGTTGGDDFNWSFDVSQAKPSANNRAIKYLWARQKIKMLDDYNNVSSSEDIKKEITQLGLTYNLLTNYTSFIAVDSLIRNNTGKTVAVKQPLPLPAGVSNYAVSNSVVSVTSQSKSYSTPTGSNKVKKNTSSASIDTESNAEESIAETVAEFAGGESAMKAFIEKNLVIPVAAQSAGITGSVYVEFSLDMNGVISDVKVIKSLGFGCDEEAIRIVKLMTKLWTPAKENGTAIASTQTVIIKFKST